MALGGGFPCCVCLWRGACAWCPCWRVYCVFVVSVLVVVRVWVCLSLAFVCVCVRVRCVEGLWLPVLASPGWGLLVVLVWVWLVCAVVGPSPLLAIVPECDSPPLPAAFCCRLCWVFLATPG